MFDIPYQQAWDVYRQWSRQYGSDIIRVRAPGKNIVVLNSLEAVTDLFEKKSSIYSDRFHSTLLHDLVGFRWAVSLTGYGKRFKDSRRVLHKEFNEGTVKRYRDVEARSTHRLLFDLLRDPRGYETHIQGFAARVIMKVTYDIDLKANNDPFVSIAEEATDAFSIATASMFLVDLIPMLRFIPEWVPGAGFQRQARLWRHAASLLLNEPWESVKSRMAKGESFECVTTRLLEGVEQTDEGDEPYMQSIIAGAMGTMYGAATHTTISTLTSFFLAMVLYPEVQQKAQVELTQVLGNKQLPTFSDMDNLPYVGALVSECMRWPPIIPLAVPHRVMEDDVYKGYYIPKGTIVMGNTQSILHNEEIYPEPTRFYPERYLSDGERDPSVRDPASILFGFGRRVCPGRFMAKDIIWITIASILHVYDIHKERDVNGYEITPEISFGPGAVTD
ncbi:hypothetical protein NLI96_g5365 [Meripilus lineatus]|uniref:Cytochrome P450 n=1 Tax=Meripilus lineatus TaxID=2056292 RepID=A0AAD5YJ25_9APHY|nr:hypothetical protein NLI96_g5365 [Physisporinus lineatus]